MLSARPASCSRPAARIFLKKGGEQSTGRHTCGLTAPYLSSHSLFDSLFLILYLHSPSPPTTLFPPPPVSLFPPSSSVLHLLFFSSACHPPCSPVSTNPTCVCAPPGSRLRLPATPRCLFYFKSPDRHANTSERLKKSLRCFWLALVIKIQLISLCLGAAFPYFRVFIFSFTPHLLLFDFGPSGAANRKASRFLGKVSSLSHRGFIILHVEQWKPADVHFFFSSDG